MVRTVLPVNVIMSIKHCLKKKRELPNIVKKKTSLAEHGKLCCLMHLDQSSKAQLATEMGHQINFNATPIISNNKFYFPILLHSENIHRKSEVLHMAFSPFKRFL